MPLVSKDLGYVWQIVFHNYIPRFSSTAMIFQGSTGSPGQDGRAGDRVSISKDIDIFCFLVNYDPKATQFFIQHMSSLL